MIVKSVAVGVRTLFVKVVFFNVWVVMNAGVDNVSHNAASVQVYYVIIVRLNVKHVESTHV